MLKNIFFLPVLLIIVVFSSSQFVSAQHFTSFSDEHYIQLKLDLIRKGIQQEDTCKILMAFSSDVSSKDKYLITKESLAQRFQAILEKASERDIKLPRPNFPRSDSRLKTSDFWDFDIIDPKIKILGDSAIVDCELVLWGEIADNPQKGLGRKVKERFVFKSLSISQITTIDPDSTGTFKSKANKIKSSWQLVEFDSLLDFLDSIPSLNVSSNEKSREETK
ncbi:MAG: hypothetical protein PHN52_00730 [candidate division Zixibacteria bacterium]|nr:hypothetical protein [candidate division Zixibacteria bacterium]